MQDDEDCSSETASCETPAASSELTGRDGGRGEGPVNGSGSSVTLGLPQSDQTVLIVLYSATTTLAVVGNVLAIVVFTAGRRSRTDLRWFLVNLAAADLVMAAFCMPFTFTMTMLGHWIFSAPLCSVLTLDLLGATLPCLDIGAFLLTLDLLGSTVPCLDTGFSVLTLGLLGTTVSCHDTGSFRRHSAMS